MNMLLQYLQNDYIDIYKMVALIYLRSEFKCCTQMIVNSVLFTIFQKLEFWYILAWIFSAQYRLNYPILEVKTKDGEYISCTKTTSCTQIVAYNDKFTQFI